MPSFQEVCDALIIALADEIISEEEFVVLFAQYKPQNPEFPYWTYDGFDFENLDPHECKAEFRFEKHDLPLLKQSLRIPDRFVCPQGTVCSGMEGLCILLKRLNYPCRYSDMIHSFARPVPELCMITNTVLDWVYTTHGYRLTSWNQPFLSRECLESYAIAIARKGAPLGNCFGFVDGTVRQICRPGKNQRVVYNGHKRVHALKFQAVALPNGIVANLFGPVEGRRHDAGMLKDSSVLAALQQVAYNPAGDVLCIYGDPAYPLRPQLMCPYKVGDVQVLTPQMRAFNKAMSEVRVSVEWLFGDISNYFKFIDYKKNLKIHLSAVGKQYLVSALMRNILTCFYGNMTSDYFDIAPPTVDEYLS